MSRIISRLADNANLINAAIDEYLKSSDNDYLPLFEAMRYSALSGGKRIRPTLTLEFCRMFGGDDRAALQYACAVELLHTYSLIHDDLPCMDNDELRRGKATNHMVYGEATALLAGDALLTYAFELLSGNRFVSAEQNLAAVRLLAESAGMFGMIGGQTLDLIGEKHELPFDKLLKMHGMKTGKLIGASVLLGCIAASAGPGDKRYEDASKYAEGLGLAFQVTDDILDAGEEDNKTTFLSYMDVAEAAKFAELKTDEAITAISGYAGNEYLIELARFLCKRDK